MKAPLLSYHVWTMGTVLEKLFAKELVKNEAWSHTIFILPSQTKLHANKLVALVDQKYQPQVFTPDNLILGLVSSRN